MIFALIGIKVEAQRDGPLKAYGTSCLSTSNMEWDTEYMFDIWTEKSVDEVYAYSGCLEYYPGHLRLLQIRQKPAVR